ncbi:hypothetical protein OSC27_08405 [Microbacterium sp. STN6]|uniref:hypothetical protein n=1 Tax=Microbacterium sp. STN6 TaxID=2995588 RepID=UPI002260B186|nr:hypothetical protein [Microbacterium sp. STN6]MCX7522298.1 hypothetical protein [Microbacterium sp. STN6]
MHWTRTDTARRRIVVAGLIAGPLLLVLSVAINLTAPADSMQAEFDAMATRGTLIVAEALLESVGFMIVLACLAGTAHALRHRGGALGTWGAALSILGIVGFSMSNANGFTLPALAALPDHKVAYDTAKALMSSDIMSTIGTVTMALELAGQAGIVLVIAGLIRARLISFWVLIPVALGIVLNFVGGIMLTTLIADALLAVTCTWIAVRLVRAPRQAWLGEPVVAAPSRTAQPA